MSVVFTDRNRKGIILPVIFLFWVLFFDEERSLSVHEHFLKVEVMKVTVRPEMELRKKKESKSKTGPKEFMVPVKVTRMSPLSLWYLNE